MCDSQTQTLKKEAARGVECGLANIRFVRFVWQRVHGVQVGDWNDKVKTGTPDRKRALPLE
jgi:hypothetical protein